MYKLYRVFISGKAYQEYRVALANNNLSLSNIDPVLLFLLYPSRVGWEIEER